jgi:uncharacterized membrane protein
LVVVTPAYRAATDATLFDSLTLMLAVSMVAAIWCAVFDALFEWVEHCTVRQMTGCRQNRVRLLQAVVREATENPTTLPVIYVLTYMSLQDSLMTDGALAAVYVIYGFLFIAALRPFGTGCRLGPEREGRRTCREKIKARPEWTFEIG